MKEITEKEIVSISKFLALVLRHKPELIDISLDIEGWVDTETLIKGMNGAGTQVTLDILTQIVKNDNKQRYVFSLDGKKIRAQQGHSTAVNLTFTNKKPPITLYHGTAERFISSIRQTGLDKRTRQYVHLSMDRSTANNVGGRRGNPTILEIQSLKMFEDGYTFLLSDNGVWLTDHVPTKYIIFP